MSARTRSSLDKVMKNLNKEIKKIETRTIAGMIKAAIVVRRSMDTAPPLIPVDMGNLRASFFIVSSQGIGVGVSPAFANEASVTKQEHLGVVDAARALTAHSKDPLVILGFSANYAWFVHEMVEASFQRPGAGAKFFEAALNRNHRQILEAIAGEVRIK